MEAFLLQDCRKKTLLDVYGTIGKKVEPLLINAFKEKGLEYPGEKIILHAIKDEKSLEVWACSGSKQACVFTFPFTGFSGTSGPKLKGETNRYPKGYTLLSI